MNDGSSPVKIGASRSIYYSITDDVPGLTEEEKTKLEAVMKKAQEFEAEEENKLRQPVEGQLYKYTNVMKGWQYRWFVLTPDTGVLEYYMLDERKKNRPRGALHLAGAVVAPSEEDSQSFAVSAVCGEIYKLKATDAKERQFWVDKIRGVIDKYSTSEVPSQNQKTPVCQNNFAFCKSNTFHVSEEACHKSPSHVNSEKPEVASLPDKADGYRPSSIYEIKNSVYKAVECQKCLAKSIEELPFSGSSIKCSDHRLLLIKATSQATVQSLEQCYLILRRHRQREALSATGLIPGNSLESLDKCKSPIIKKDSRN